MLFTPAYADYGSSMFVLPNPYRHAATAPDTGEGVPFPSTDVGAVIRLLDRCPAHETTPLVPTPDLALRAGVDEVWVKDERGRMGLGSFKALGAAHVIARDAVEAGGEPETALVGRTYVTASAGNHGMSVAAGARLFGAVAIVYLAETVPNAFEQRLIAKGAHVVRDGADYAASMEAAEKAARNQGWTLLSDTSWPGYTEIPLGVMQGYLVLMDEAIAQIPYPPTHILLQAGVGGLAAACAALARRVWGDGPTIVVVEPDAAPALVASIRAGKPVFAPGPDSCMGRLDCKEPSLIALKGLARDADQFVTITEHEAQAVLPRLAQGGLATTASGAAGLAVLFAVGDQRAVLGLDPGGRVLCILSEGPE